MRSSIIVAVLFSTSALLLAGCAGDSPWKLAKRDTVVIEISANDAVRVNSASIGSDNLIKELSATLQKIGDAHPGRPVTLVVDEGVHADAVPQVKRIARNARLGKVEVTTRATIKAENAPAPVVEPATEVATAPTANAAPAAVAASASAFTTAPDGTAYNPAVVVTIELNKDNDFKVDGKPVSFEEFADAISAIGKASPGKPVSFFREAGSEVRAALFIHQKCREAGLGAITVK
jgi:biopolymer transport protein ExbD